MAARENLFADIDSMEPDRFTAHLADALDLVEHQDVGPDPLHDPDRHGVGACARAAKRALAVRFRTDRAGYTAAKTAFVRAVTAQARAAAGAGGAGP